jgi:hypothetical protein
MSKRHEEDEQVEEKVDFGDEEDGKTAAEAYMKQILAGQIPDEEEVANCEDILRIFVSYFAVCICVDVLSACHRNSPDVFLHVCICVYVLLGCLLVVHVHGHDSYWHFAPVVTEYFVCVRYRRSHSKIPIFMHFV